MLDYIFGHLRKWWILATTKKMTEQQSEVLDNYLKEKGLYPKE